MFVFFKVIKKIVLVVKVFCFFIRIKIDIEWDKSELVIGKSVIFKLKDVNLF